MTPAETLELGRWRAVMGRDKPGEPVELTTTATVGRLRLTVKGERFPTALVKPLLSTRKPAKRKPRALPPAAKFTSLPGAGTYRDADVMQRNAYRAAMSTGRWAG